MFTDILKLMRCPICHLDLELANNAQTESSCDMSKADATCPNQHVWPIEDGVFAFSRNDAPSDPWSKSFKDYEKFVANKRHFMSTFASEVAPIIESIPSDSAGPCVDLCTGDGSLFFNLLNKVNPAIPVVSVDMSLHAQKYNRRYYTETQSHQTASFIASDASKLPFKDDVIPCVVSFGIGNMLGKLADGIREAQRVLQDGGIFIFTHMYVDEDSEGWRTLQKILNQQGVEHAGYHGLEKDFNTLMQDLNFSKYKVDILKEIIGDADRDTKSGPIFPYPNERQQKLLVKAWK